MKQRFYALDVFRGATIALMILVNNPGSWKYIYTPLEHASWHGCTPTDLVFPFFLFAVGNAMAFTIPALRRSGNRAFWVKTLKRTVLIFGIGLLLNWFPFIKYASGGALVAKGFGNLRILGVLQRIALCYLFASIIIYYLKPAKAFIAGIILLLLYWSVCLAFGNAADPYSLQGWFGTPIDKAILGESHMYHGEGVAFDPEGFPSTIAAITQVILGYLAGDYIVQKKNAITGTAIPTSWYTIIANLFVAGSLLVFTGFCWDMVFPINKKIWTSSFVIYTTGIAIMVLAILLHLIEANGHRGRWSRFFEVFGKNPLFIFVLSGVWVRLYGLVRIPADNGYEGLGGWMYSHVFAPMFGNMNGSLLYAIFHVIIFWAIAWWLDKKKIYIKV